MIPPTTTDNVGTSQVQQTDPGLDTAMTSWGDGEQGGGQTAPTQSTPPTEPQAAPPGQTAPATVPAVAPTTQQSNADLVRAAVEATASAMQARQPAAPRAEPKTMTDAEFAQRYGIQNYDVKYIERLFDKDPVKAAEVLNEIQRNAYVAAVRMANDLITAQISQTQSQFAPRIQAVEKFIAEQNERAATERFYKSYPTLSPEADLVKEVLDATQAKISRGELRFTTEQQAFQYVADATNRVVSRMSKPGSAVGGQQSPTGTRQMASATQSARPGGQAAKPKSDLDSVMASWDEAPE